MRRRLLLASALLALVLGATAAAWLNERPLAYVAPATPPAMGAAAVISAEDEGADAGLEGAVDGVSDAALDGAADGATDSAVSDTGAAIAPVIPVRTEAQRTPSFRGTRNYLLVGIDHTHGVWGRADTLVVAVFDDDSGHVGLVSITRDLYVNIPEHGPARINTMFRIATRTGQDPLEVARRVVSDTLAMPIHHVVVGNLDAFETTIDALGGVAVDVPCPIIDRFIDPRTPSGRRLLDVPEGRQRMDGVTAAMYVRSRHGRSDWSRARRQQALLFGLRDRVRELSAAEWVPVLGDSLEGGVTTDLTRFEMIRLARRVSRMDRRKIHGLVLGYRTMQAYRTPENRAVQLPDFDAMDEALRGLFEAPAPGVLPRRARCQEADAALR